MFMIGLTGLKPIVGNVVQDSLADHAGLELDQEIIAVESRKTSTWAMVIDSFIDKIVDGQQVHITVREKTGLQQELVINLSSLSIDDLAESGLLEKLGMEPKKIKVPAIIGSVQKGLPAALAGLSKGDHIIAADGKPISDWLDWVKYIQAHPEQEMTVELIRNDLVKKISLIPQKNINDDGQVIGYIGAANKPPIELFGRETYSFFPALIKAVERTWDMSWLTLRVLGKLITGQASYKNLSGPISIAKFAGDSAESGVATFLWFLGIVSVSLGVLNLLPIPILDGGHLMYYLIEFVKGSPVSEAAQIIGQQIGFALLLCLMILVFYNDIVRLMG
jgi:regulator of sigma E protease